MTVFRLKLNLTRIANYPVFVRLIVFALILILFWLPIAAPVYWLWGTGNSTSIVMMVVLYVEFIVLLKWWGRNVHQQLEPLRTHGLVGTRRNGLFGSAASFMRRCILLNLGQKSCGHCQAFQDCFCWG